MFDGLGDETELTQLRATVDETSPRQFATVGYVGLKRTHSGPRAPEKQRPVSSVGLLDSGEPYIIYRIVLFWDGFNIQGKSASEEGVYMLCLNIPERSRASKNAVRILTLTQPVVKSVAALQNLLDDILESATEGVVDCDADGHKTRILIYLVGILGDPAAVNGNLDVLGHTATACCHLCRFVRRSDTGRNSACSSAIELVGSCSNMIVEM